MRQRHHRLCDGQKRSVSPCCFPACVPSEGKGSGGGKGQSIRWLMPIHLFSWASGLPSSLGLVPRKPKGPRTADQRVSPLDAASWVNGALAMRLEDLPLAASAPPELMDALAASRLRCSRPRATVWPPLQPLRVFPSNLPSPTSFRLKGFVPCSRPSLCPCLSFLLPPTFLPCSPWKHPFGNNAHLANPHLTLPAPVGRRFYESPEPPLPPEPSSSDPPGGGYTREAHEWLARSMAAGRLPNFSMAVALNGKFRGAYG